MSLSSRIILALIFGGAAINAFHSTPLRSRRSPLALRQRDGISGIGPFARSIERLATVEKVETETAQTENAEAHSYNYETAPFKRVMAANRAEIAVRIMRAATELNMESIGIYGNEDRKSAHRWGADKSFELPASGTPAGAYLNIENIIKVAKDNNVDAIHPGYGFLSESPEFAAACAEAGITFVGPTVENLLSFSDKTKAREMAIAAGVAVVPGTDGAVTSPEQAEEFVDEFGLPVIIKASMGGGGKGMRVVRNREDLVPFFESASSEALASFGDGSCFIERYVDSPRHIEVQIVGDGKGNVVHLWERDCSVQRRHQKVIEIAPAWNLPMELRLKLHDDAVRLTAANNYKNAGTVEFLVDKEGRHYFIEVNPRIQVEHTVTEEVTGIDLVQTQILVAGGASFEELGLKQENIVPRGCALQCRITTENCERDFAPDTGVLSVYRHSSGPGMRVDGIGYSGMAVTPYYDSLLVKYTARAATWELVVRRMRRALLEMTIRGVKTNISFLLNVLAHQEFIAGTVTTSFIDQNPNLLKIQQTKWTHRHWQSSHKKVFLVEKYLRYIANVAVNGHPATLGASPDALKLMPSKEVVPPDMKAIAEAQAGCELAAPKWRALMREQGPAALAKAVREHKGLLVTDTTWRDAHQSLLATRMRTHDLERSAEATTAVLGSQAFSLEMWGGATFDVSMRFLHECPWKRLKVLREAVPDIPFQMLLRGANGVGYTSYPDNVVFEFCKKAFEEGIDIFRVFDSLNYAENMRLGIEAAAASGGFVEAAICYTGDVTNDSPDNKYSLSYYMDYAAELVEMGTHSLAIKDMAGLLTPAAATLLVSNLREAFPDVPIHVHTHDTVGAGVTSMLAAADAGADIVDGAIDAMSGMTSQPSLGAIIAATQGGAHDTGISLKSLQPLNRYWEDVRFMYIPFESGQLSSSSDVFEHEIPGGQYTNLLFQSKQLGLTGRFSEIKRAYAQANMLLGDIPKVTPSSKVVGDLAQFIVAEGLTPEEIIEDATILNLPNSVVEYFQGTLGSPPGGFPEPLRSRVLEGRPLADGRACYTGRPGAEMEPYNFEEAAASLKEVYGEERISDLDVLSHAMYPAVFKEWLLYESIYGELESLPTHVFVRPMSIGDEVHFKVGDGRRYFLTLDAISDVDASGSRQVTFEVNGERWFIRTTDETPVMTAGGGGARREKADSFEKGSVGCSMPGVVVDVRVKEGNEVKAGEPLFILSAMKMETTIKAPISGIVGRVLANTGDNVEADDLLAVIEESTEPSFLL